MGPAPHELLFGVVVVYVWNTLYFEKALNLRLSWWRHLVITLWGSSAFLINTLLDGSPLKMPLTLVHTAILIGLFIWLLVIPVKASLIQKILLAFCVVSFTAVFMTAESVARAITSLGRMEPMYFILFSIGMVIALVNWEIFRPRFAAG